MYSLDNSIVTTAARSGEVGVFRVQNTSIGVLAIRRSHANNVGPSVGKEDLSNV